MSRPPPAVAEPAPDEDRHSARTELAFVLAPGIAAVTGCTLIGILVATRGPGLTVGEALVGTLYMSFWTGLIGYVTMGLFAVPLYRVAPEDVRRSVFAVTPMAGLAAAAPWLLLSLLAGPFGLIAAAVAFGFGCVAGVAFVLIRGAPPG